jgi:ABC-2 type transport system permease protein
MFFFNRAIEDSGAGPGAVMEVDATVDMPEAAIPDAFGYVDPGGFIASIPAQVPSGMAQAYPDEASAQQALEDGAIGSFFFIPVDFVDTGEIIQVRADFSPMSANTPYGWMNWILLVNLLDNDLALAAQVWNPVEFYASAATPTLSPEAEAAVQEELEDQERLTTMLIMLLFYAVIVMASGFLLRTVSEEKKSRTIEVLMLSANSQQILLGKTIGLGLAGLIQAVGWSTIGYLLFSLGGAELRLPASMEFSLDFIIAATVFLLLGYAIYATLYAGAGALVPNWREAQGISLLIILPAFVGFEISLFQADTPHSMLMVVASIFPLTAPFTMIKRLLHGGVPLWQLLLAVGLMLGATYVITRAVARMFHAQNLLSGQPLSVRRYFRALLGQG